MKPGRPNLGSGAAEFSIESLAAEIAKDYDLSSLHIFTSPTDWRVFGFRKDPKGYQASVENGRGEDVRAALNSLDARLHEGPIHRQTETKF